MHWQKNLAQGFNHAAELLTFLELPQTMSSLEAEKSFKTRVPREFASRMTKGDPQDPLLLQVLASPSEQLSHAEFTSDPLAEGAANLIPGLIHKYSGRVLLTLTPTCAINCRYCFRRHFDYKKNTPGTQGWQKTIEYIAENPSIHEVILSGGDPLLASDGTFAALYNQLETIPHLKLLRFHSRIPIVLPERITPTWLDLLKNTRLQKIMVLHCNHPQEINDRVVQACDDLKAAGFHLLNQSVLLKGVNDDVDILKRLSLRLFQAQVLPYYLHLLDKVAGAVHFDLSLERAYELYEALQSSLPGYLVPKLVKEEAGRRHKTRL